MRCGRVSRHDPARVFVRWVHLYRRVLPVFLGVPIITLRGVTPHARVTASLLAVAASNHTEAMSWKDYEDLYVDGVDAATTARGAAGVAVPCGSYH